MAKTLPQSFSRIKASLIAIPKPRDGLTGPALPFLCHTIVALSICVNTFSTAASLVIAVITFLFFTLTM